MRLPCEAPIHSLFLLSCALTSSLEAFLSLYTAEATLLRLIMFPRRHILLLPPPESRFGPPSRVSPVDLPDDVLLRIFERLSHARDIAAVRGVCISWRLLIDRTETIWRSLVFDLPRCARNAPYAETWYRKAADYGNSQAQVGCSALLRQKNADSLFVALFADRVSTLPIICFSHIVWVCYSLVYFRFRRSLCLLCYTPMGTTAHTALEPIVDWLCTTLNFSSCESTESTERTIVLQFMSLLRY